MAFIGIKIPHDVSRLFRDFEFEGERVSENDHHITVVCFEENWPLNKISKTMETVYEIIHETEPFLVKSDEITCFPKREDNPVPVIAKFKSKELIELNKNIKAALDKKKIKYMNNFKDYKPHMTLAYGPEEINTVKIEPVEFVVHEITLWAGDNGDDRLFITFPLKSPARKKNSFLEQKTSLFQKLAKNKTLFAFE